jgi:hypothetical protein
MLSPIPQAKANCPIPLQPKAFDFLGYGKMPTLIFPSSDRPGVNSRNYHSAEVPVVRLRRNENQTKRKGSFPCEKPPFVRFFEDLVRLPNHNVVIPKSFAARELGPRSLTFPVLLVVRASQHHSRSSSPILSKAPGYSLLLEDCSSVELILVDNSPEDRGAITFCVVEMM